MIQSHSALIVYMISKLTICKHLRLIGANLNISHIKYYILLRLRLCHLQSMCLHNYEDLAKQSKLKVALRQVQIPKVLQAQAKCSMSICRLVMITDQQRLLLVEINSRSYLFDKFHVKLMQFISMRSRNLLYCLISISIFWIASINITILNLIMDEICPIPARIRTLHRINQMFTQICNDERLFALLYEFISFSDFVQLSATNSQIKNSINRHEQVQVYILQLKVKKLKERQFKRLYPNPFRVDLHIFNPYTLPVYIQEAEAEGELTNQEIQKERAIAEIKKLKNEEIVGKNNWRKWRANKRIENMFGIRPKVNGSNGSSQFRLNSQEQVSLEEQMRVIKQAQKIVELDREFRSKLLSESMTAPNQLQALKNKHFVEKFLKKEENADRNLAHLSKVNKKIRPTQIQQQKQISQMKALQIFQFDEFHEAWSDTIRKRAIKKMFKTERTSQSSLWIPLPSLPRGLGNLLEIPGFLAVAKQKVSNFLLHSNSQ